MIAASIALPRSPRRLRRRCRITTPGDQRRIHREICTVAERRERHLAVEQQRVAVGVQVAEPEEEESESHAHPREPRLRAVHPDAGRDREHGREAEHVDHRPAAGERLDEQVQRRDERSGAEEHNPRPRGDAEAVAGARRHAASLSSSPRGRSSPSAASVLERCDQRVDLVVRVRRRELNAESDLVLRDERIRGQRDVDASIEQEAPDRIDSPMVSERHLDDRKAGAIRRLNTERTQRGRAHAPRAATAARAARRRALVHVEARKHGREGCHRARGPSRGTAERRP